MARPKSNQKRNAILEAAAEIVAEKGAGAGVAAIASRAGIAEGTLFIYFATKDLLLQELYREIKVELADAVMSGFPRRADVQERFRHVWQGYLSWCLQNPRYHAVLRQLEIWGYLSEQARASGASALREIEELAREAVEIRALRDLPSKLVASTMIALAEMTLDRIQQESAAQKQALDAGFELFWRATSRKLS